MAISCPAPLPPPHADCSTPLCKIIYCCYDKELFKFSTISSKIPRYSERYDFGCQIFDFLSPKVQLLYLNITNACFPLHFPQNLYFYLAISNDIDFVCCVAKYGNRYLEIYLFKIRKKSIFFLISAFYWNWDFLWQYFHINCTILQWFCIFTSKFEGLWGTYRTQIWSFECLVLMMSWNILLSPNFFQSVLGGEGRCWPCSYTYLVIKSLSGNYLRKHNLARK